MKRNKSQKGFTLLEMMIVVAILAILAAMAYPSFQYLLANNRAKAAASLFNKTFAYARSEAISRNSYVGICPIKPGASDSCADSLTDCPSIKNPTDGCVWSNGFLVYVDKDINYGYDPGKDEIIQHFYVTEKPVIIEAPGVLNFVWKAGGLVLRTSQSALANKTVTIIPATDTKSPNYLRECVIAATGRLLCSAKK